MLPGREDAAMTETRKRGSPVEKPEPEPLSDSSENVLGALVKASPRREDEWDYLKGTTDNAQ